MEPISVSIIPTYYCNYNCKYCYLGILRNDTQLLSLDCLKSRLNELTKCYKIKSVSIYGGEVSLLNKQYLKDLYNLIKIYDNVSITTNLSNDWIVKWCEDHNIHMAVSLNEERDDYNKILNKLFAIENKNNITLSVVVLPSLLKRTPEEIMNFYDKLGFNVYFIQYHPSKYNTLYNIDQREYNVFLEEILKIKNNYQIKVENEIILLDKDHNPTMKGFIFLNPYGKWSSVRYNNGIEDYPEYISLDEWEKECAKEYTEYLNKCCLCEMFGKCKAEHLANYNKPYCSGLYNIMQKYQYK